MIRILALAVVLTLGAGAASAAPPHCVKGKLCGNTCIAKGKVCHVAPRGPTSFSAGGPYVGLKYIGNVGN